MRRTMAQISHNMSRIRSSGSLIECTLGIALWASGIRYRKQYRMVPGRPDFALVRSKIAIFCDSSFWHGRDWPAASTAFKRNKSFWVAKIRRNIARDREVNRQLKHLGWAVIRFWDDDILRKTDRCVLRVKTLSRERINAGTHDENRRHRFLLRRRRDDKRPHPRRDSRTRRH